ncbi:MAG: histidine kinase [Saprospiraceae bacterium]|nr:histidine kinase [Saprospiraceae bacterium]
MSSSAFAASKIRDLENRLTNIQDDSKKMLAMSEVSEFYTFTNIREAQKLLAELQKLLQKHHHHELILNFHLNTAIVENQFYNYKLSEIHFQQALEIVENEGNVSQQVEVYIDYAGTLINLNEKEKAMTFIEKARRHLTAFPDPILEARLICREGNVWLHYTDYDKATELLFQAEKMYADIESKKLQIKDLYFQTLVYSGLGLIFEKTGDRARCVKAYRRVVEMCEKAGIKSRLAWHYVNVGKAYMAIDDYDNAEEFFLKADRIKDDISLSARAHATANLGFCYYLGGRYDEALELYNRAEVIYKRKTDDYENLSILSRWKGLLFDAIGKSKRAEKRLVEALELAKLGRDTKQQAIICSDIADMYADRGDFRNAYDYEVLHNQFVKKYYEETNKIKIDELEFKYEAERRRKEAELLRLQATKLQLKALRAQMNPHFMFNALNSIQYYINSNDREYAGKCLARFAKLMRSSLEYSELEVISLESEIEFLEDYLIINQQLRFENRLTYSLKMDEDLEEDIIGVPTMIVQPYIENAIEHGIRPKKSGHIKIEFKMIDDTTILCIIEDNGIGRVKARELQAQDEYHLKHKSRGTSITEKRLEILHATKKDAFFVKTIDLNAPLSNEPIGTRVEIQIPIVELPFKNQAPEND